MRTPHQIGHTFDSAGLRLAGVAAGFVADARAHQAAVDAEQADRDLTATQRVAVAVARQRAALQDAVDEAAALRTPGCGPSSRPPGSRSSPSSARPSASRVSSVERSACARHDVMLPCVHRARNKSKNAGIPTKREARPG